MQGRLLALARPVRTVLGWQAGATCALALAGALAEGVHGALSAALGGAVSMTAGWLSALLAARRAAPTAGGILVAALTAEGVRIAVIALLLWLVLQAYGKVVVIAFLGSFMITVLLSGMAFFVRAND